MKGYRVVFDQVTVHYPGMERAALSEFSMIMEPGEKVAIVGPTGAGKSTVLDLLQGFIKPTAGNITVDGIPLEQLALRWWREQLAVLAQEPHLFYGTVMANIRLGSAEASDAAVIKAAQAAQADGFIGQLPQQYETVLSESVQLSGGQAQRIAMARAMLRKSPLFLLDEPTSGLDLANEAAVTATMEQLTAGRMALMVAHRLKTFRMRIAS